MIYQKFKICTTNLPFGCTTEGHGVDNWASFCLFKQLETEGYDKYGNKYEVEGNRKSGDPNTSCGNTIVNGIANAFVFAQESARRRGVDVMKVKFDDPELDFNSLILGDDNITCINKDFEEFVTGGRYAAELLKLGF